MTASLLLCVSAHITFQDQCEFDLGDDGMLLAFRSDVVDDEKEQFAHVLWKVFKF